MSDGGVRVGQKIPVGPWPDFHTACAFGGNVLLSAAKAFDGRVTEWAAVKRQDGLWKVEGFLHQRGQDYSTEGNYVRAGAD